MMSLTPVVRNLLIINVILFVASQVMNLGVLSLYPVFSEDFRPFQLATHFFMHASFFHILFNMFALANIGPMLEQTWGPERFFRYYIFCALGAAFLQLGVNYYQYQQVLTGAMSVESAMGIGAPMVGASGAIFGLIVALAVYFPNMELTFFPIPIPIKAKYFVPILMLLELFLGSQRFEADNIAHYAHLGGALTGLLLLFVVKRF